MHLINTKTLELEFFYGSDEVPYGILSHRWATEEITYQEMQNGTARAKLGYQKVSRACQQAQKEGLVYLWVDTCCIDKTSSAELSEAINSMFSWYRDAQVCYVYLADVDTLENLDRSAWFTRGWTLQELIAPIRSIFFSSDWVAMGTKADLSTRLSQITSVPPTALTGQEKLSRWSVAQRMSWAAGRLTTRPEDRAYSLLGIFGINMPLLYGEGRRAVVRLQEEIIKYTDDQSIFAWHLPSQESLENWQDRETDEDPIDATGLLATSLDYFAGCSRIARREPALEWSTFGLTNRGLSVSLPNYRVFRSSKIALLNCTEVDARSPANPLTIGIFIRELSEPGQHARVTVRCQDRVLIDKACWDEPDDDFDGMFSMELKKLHRDMRDRRLTKPIIHELSEYAKRRGPYLECLNTSNLFFRQDPLESCRFLGRKLFGLRIRRFTPFHKDCTFDPVKDCFVRCLNAWDWTRRCAILPEPCTGDVCRIYIPGKKVKIQTHGPLPPDALSPDEDGMLSIPSILLSFGFDFGHYTTVREYTEREYMFTAMCTDEVHDEKALAMMTDPRPDAQVLTEETSEVASRNGLRLPLFSGYRDCKSVRLECSPEIIDGVETKVLDVHWNNWSRCDGCGETMTTFQYCCVSCTSPAYDCCGVCFEKISESAHDKQPGNASHEFRLIRVTTYYGSDKVLKSSRLVKHEHDERDCYRCLL